MEIKKGMAFHCKKDFVMEEGSVAYTAGKTYYSEKDGCITDNENYILHQMESDGEDFYLEESTKDDFSLEEYFDIESFEVKIPKVYLCTDDFENTENGFTFHKGYIYPSKLVEKIPNMDEILNSHFSEISQNQNFEIQDSSNKASNICEFKELTSKMLEIYKMKNADYGDSFNKLIDEIGLISSATRIGDKWMRLVQLAKGNEAKVKDEKIEDTLLDMANYCVMTIMWMNNQKK